MKRINRTKILILALILVVVLTGALLAWGLYTPPVVSALAMDYPTLRTLFAEGSLGNLPATYDPALTLSFASAENARNAFILLSHTDPAVYQGWTLEITPSALDLVPSYTTSQGTLSFLGLGSADTPFNGAIVRSFGSDPLTIDLATPLFAGVTPYAHFIDLNLRYRSSAGACFAHTVTTQGITPTTPAHHHVTVLYNQEGHASGGLIETIASGTTEYIEVHYLDDSSTNLQAFMLVGASSAGLVANTLEANATLVLEGFTHAASTLSGTLSLRVSSTGDNAGAGFLVGTALAGSTLSVTGGLDIPTGISYDISGAHVGGIIGSGLDCTITATTPITLKQGISLTTNALQGTAGGVYGRYTISTPIVWDTFFSFPGARITARNQAYNGIMFNGYNAGASTQGGLIGLLELSGKNASFTYAPATPTDVYADFTVRHYGNNESKYSTIGGVIGAVVATNPADGVYPTAILSNIIASVWTETNTAKANIYGGLIGSIARGNVGVDVTLTRCQTLDYKPWAQGNGFGGAVSRVYGGGQLKIDGFTLNIFEEPNVDGCLVVADIKNTEAVTSRTSNRGGVVVLAGHIDLSACTVRDSGITANLVAGRGNDLLFAESGMTYSRPQATQAGIYRNDVGTYGNLVRLGPTEGNPVGLPADLYVRNPVTRVWSFNTAYAPIKVSNKNYQLASPAHLIAVMTGIQSNNWYGFGVSKYDLNTSTYTLTADLDMSGTGFTCLQRDTWEDHQSFQGVINGGGHTITIRMGEQWGNQGALPLGDGAIVALNVAGLEQHSNTGFFCEAGGMTIRALTFDGDFRYNIINQYTKAGVLSAIAHYNITLEDVTIATQINSDICRGIDSQLCSLFGYADSSNGNTLNLIRYTDRSTMNLPAVSQRGSFGVIGMTNNGWGTTNITDCVLSNTVFMHQTGNTAAECWAGGLWAEIRDSNNRVVNISGLVFDGASYTTERQNVVGGLLGGTWGNARVVISGTDEKPGITVRNSTVLAPNSSVGGLVYYARNLWQVGAYGIRMESFSLTAQNSVGFLLGDSAPRNANSGVYLELSSPTSYDSSGVTALSTAGKEVDEITFRTYLADVMSPNGTGGSRIGQSVVSICTTDGGLLDVNSRNSYANRTTQANGNAWFSPYTRYYYNLHTMRTKSDANRTPAERLMMWSVYQYANAQIQSYFQGSFTDNVLSGNIDLTGYSYYPTFVEQAVTIAPGTTITFDHSTIEGYESTNISTLPTASRRTQHYAMHTGLIYKTLSDITVGGEGSPVTLRGSVGRFYPDPASPTHYSGFILTHTMGGTNAETKLNLSLRGIRLDDAYVSGYQVGQTASLLVGYISAYANVTVSDVATVSNAGSLYATRTATDGWYAAGSLMGRAGNSSAVGLAYTFSGIVLDSRTATGDYFSAYGTYRSIFARATLLEYFYYQGASSGSYNFTLLEDWPTESNHAMAVTYGRELSLSVRNPQQQYAYFGSTEAIHPTQYPSGTDYVNYFGTGYLPYVYDTREGNANAEYSKYHELDVNLQVYYLDIGCGTYNHPYSISTSGQLTTLASYFITGTPGARWVVRFSHANATPIASRTHTDTAYIYSESRWMVASHDGAQYQPTATELSNGNAVILAHLLSAYYRIDDNLTLPASYTGLGTENNPFSGVICDYATGSFGLGAGHTITLTADTPTPLVRVAMGAALVDLRIHYAPKHGALTITNDVLTAGQFAPYFGSAIGLAKGGDNILDTISITYAADVPLTISGSHDELITVGGLVGIVSRGSVVLRGVNQVGLPAGIQSYFNQVNRYLYVNPIVGRVLDACVYAESGDYSALSTKNYQINTLHADTRFTFSKVSGYYHLSFPTAESFLIYGMMCASDMVNVRTGATTHYTGYLLENYRARGSSTYHSIGTTDGDYNLSEADDKANVGYTVNAYPYMLRKYAIIGSGTNIGELSRSIDLNKTIDLSAIGTVDLTPYGNAFAGFGYRYAEAQRAQFSPTPFITTGPIVLDMWNTEYDYDNFASRRFAFVPYMRAAGPVTDVTLQGGIRYTCYDRDGNDRRSNGTDGGNRCVVAGFAGTIQASITFQRVHLGAPTAFDLGTLTIKGCDTVGGIIGSVSANDPSTYIDCTMYGLTVDGLIQVGGFQGFSRSTTTVEYTVPTTLSGYTIRSVVPNDIALDVSPYAGGLFAQIDGTLDMTPTARLTLAGSVLYEHQGVESQDNRARLGGVVGYFNSSSSCTISNVSLSGARVADSAYAQNGTSNRNIGGNGTVSAAGLVGSLRQNANGSNVATFSDIVLDGVTIIGSRMAGGLFSECYATAPVHISRITIAPTRDCIVWAYMQAGALFTMNASANASINISEVRMGSEDAQLLVYGARVSNSDTHPSVGGIWGNLEQSTTLNISRVAITHTTVAGANHVGGLGGCMSNHNSYLRLSDISISHSRILGTRLSANESNKDGGHFGVGAIYGASRASGTVNDIDATGILIDNTQVGRLSDYTVSTSIMPESQIASWFTDTRTPQTDTFNVGRIVGSVRSNVHARISGISIVGGVLPTQEFGYNTYRANNSGFIIYGDYLAAGRPQEDGFTTVAHAPASSLILDNGDTFSIYGDATALSSGTPIASTIYSQATRVINPSAGTGYYATLLSDAILSPALFSSYNALQNGTLAEDLAVLLIDKESNAEVDALVHRYIDLVTNGGATAYRNLAPDHMFTVDITSYHYEDGRFVATPNPSMNYRVNNEGNYSFGVITGRNDAGEARFTLLTITFNNMVGDYTLYIPVLVNRPVEVTIDFHPVQGTVFNPAQFSSSYNVLTEYGKKVTLYVRFTYDYAWNEVFADPTNNLDQWSYRKNILFAITQTEGSSLPAGTNLTLIDGARGNLPFFATLANTAYSLDFEAIFPTWDSLSMADLIKMEPVTDTTTTGYWVKAPAYDENQTMVSYHGSWYRLATLADGTADLYKLRLEEVYYVIIDTPTGLTDYREFNFQTPGRLESSSLLGYQNLLTMVEGSASNQLQFYQDISAEFVKESEALDETVITTAYVPLNNEENTISISTTATLSGDTRLLTTGIARYGQIVLGLERDGRGMSAYFTDTIHIDVTLSVDGGTPYNYSLLTAGGQSVASLSLPIRSPSGDVLNLVPYMLDDSQVDVSATIRLTFFEDGSIHTFPTPATVSDMGVPDAYVTLRPSFRISDNIGFASGTTTPIDALGMVGYYLASDALYLLEFNADHYEQLGITPPKDAASAPDSLIGAHGNIDVSMMAEGFALYDSISISINLSKKGMDGAYHTISDPSAYLSRLTVGGTTLVSDEHGVYTTSVSRGDDAFGGLLHTDIGRILIPVELAVHGYPTEDGVFYTNYRVELTVIFSSSIDGVFDYTLNQDHIIYTIARLADTVLS